MYLGLTQHLTEISTRNLLAGIGQAASQFLRLITSLPSVSDYLQNVTAWMSNNTMASMACCRDSFTFIYYLSLTNLAQDIETLCLQAFKLTVIKYA
jgi:hypothetical protein